MSNYIISDAAKIINVENHVLRNWEDELSLNIPRNDLGHRIYTDDNILELQTIKKLKFYGFSLKHIKSLIPYFSKINTLSTEELLKLKNQFYDTLQEQSNDITPDKSNLDKLKPIVHYIILDFIHTVINLKR